MKATARRTDRPFRVDIDPAVCDGCGICIFFCKPAVFEMSRRLNRHGIYPALSLRPELCNGCRLCEVACPQLAILVCAADERDAEP